MSDLEDINATRERATALYTFLKEFTELHSKTTRTVDQYEQILWFSDVPREPECECAAWHRGEDGDRGEVWLAIRQPRLTPVPRPPAELEPWLIRDQIKDSAIEIPDLREEISVPIQDESGEQHFERRVVADWPNIKVSWERYVEDQWWPWAEAHRRAQSVQRVYTQLFSIYQKQQRLGEQYEVVLGLGLLSWRTPDHHEVLRHLVTASASVSFDAARGIMTIGPAGEGAKPQIEQDMLDPTHRPDPEELRALESQVGEVGEQLWDPTRINAILAGWVRSASPKGIYDENLSPLEMALPDPKVNFAPALILRKRTDRSYLKAFEEIIRQLKEGAEIPPGLGRFVTGTDDSETSGDQDRSNPSTAGELYFPLEWNDAQRQIVDRLSRHQGVLVQGPPGTGKSHTIVNLICHLLASGERVLVTSHTARALKVLQRFIRDRVPDISPLIVVLLGDDRDALQAMEDSVQGITQRHNHWDTSANLRRIADLEAQLKEAHRAKACVLSKLCAIRERETYVHPPRFGAYEGTLQKIGARLRREEDAFAWLQDHPTDEQEQPLSSEHFQELLSLLRDTALNKWESAGVNALQCAALPSSDAIADLVARESQTQVGYDNVSELRSQSEYAPLLNANAETRERLVEALTNLLGNADQIGRHLHAWADRAVREILGDHDRVWRENFDLTREHLSCIGDCARWADETPISGLGDRDHHEVRADVEAILAHLEGGGGWGIGPFRAAPAKRALYLRREVKVGGRTCTETEQLKSLISWLDVEHRLTILREWWASIHTINPRSAFSAQVQVLEDLCEPLEAALALYKRKEEIHSLIQGVPGLSEPTWHDLDTLRLLRDCGKAVDFELTLADVREWLNQARDQITAQVSETAADPAGQDLIRALDSRDLGGYRDAFARVSRNEQRSRSLKRRESLLSKLQRAAPIVADQLAETKLDESWDHRASQFEAAWNWARARAWLEHLCDPDVEQQLLLQLDSAQDRIRNRLKDIAAKKAWSHCFARMTEHERQHLVAWSKAVRSIGKGTGKYAALHRQNAREHMNECRSAIPGWVMPIYRVAETIKPGSERFDVVIIDEASQSGPEALLLTYLAKKLVVVGDDKQISPTHTGINHEDVNHLRAHHLANVPHADSYGVHQSFFDLAEIRYQGRIRLREHFRCMPEIIQFSNNLCYTSEPLIPLRQYGSARLSPVVSVHHVQDGYLKGSGQRVNPPEAQAIVDQVLRMNRDDAYKGKSFGIISLLGQSQAQEIETLLLDKLGPEPMEKRQLVCGDASAFQGDERDVILLSLVSAPNEHIRTLTDDATRRRFNVAASRARDQLLLFHTATLNDLSPRCFRYELLQYCQNPAVEGLKVLGRPVSEFRHLAATADRDRTQAPDPFESWFEVDVFLRLADRGYRVLPQYEMAGYRMDLVVQGIEGRLAVECDGDRWHGPERYEEGMARQRTLERCGLKFWRVRGSAFSLNSDGALKGLWKTLEREGIYPGAHRSPAEEQNEAAVTVPGTYIEHTQGTDHGSNARSPVEVEPQNNLTIKPASTKIATHPVEKQRVEALQLADAAYITWSPSAHVPDPTKASPADLIPTLVEIVGTEGPMSVEQLYQIFVKGAGRQRVGRQSRRTLNKAVWKAIREGHVEELNETGQSGMKGRILRTAASPSVVVRPRGNREFVEIPPSEVTTVMLRLERQDKGLSPEALYRAVLDFYDTKRMTTNIKERLKWIHERRVDLEAAESLDRRDLPESGGQNQSS